MDTKIVNYKNVLACKVMILKKGTAETPIQNGGFVITFQNGTTFVIPFDYLLLLCF